MSMVYDPGDLPADVLFRAASVVAFLTEALTRDLKAGRGLVLSDEALAGYDLITQSLANDLRLAARAT